MPPTENDLLKPIAESALEAGQRPLARGRSRARRRRQGAGRVGVSRQGEGRRSRRLLSRRGDGKELWKAPLTYNPWGGPTLAGDTVIVTTSSIAYDPKELEGAKGEVVALDLATGKEKWKKPVPGGVLGCAAATKDAAVFTCTDGKLRAFDLKDGSRKVIYDAKAPFFAPPAVVGDVAYRRRPEGRRSRGRSEDRARDVDARSWPRSR